MAVLIIFDRRQTFSTYNDTVALTIHPKTRSSLGKFSQRPPDYSVLTVLYYIS